jgi:hypothetical protein
MYRIKNLEAVTIKAFQTGNFDKADKESTRNDLIITRLFNDTLSGKIKGFYLIDKTHFKAYHRSPKKSGYIQLSVGFYKNGELYPTYDIQLETASDCIKEGYDSGFYETIA